MNSNLIVDFGLDIWYGLLHKLAVLWPIFKPFLASSFVYFEKTAIVYVFIANSFYGVVLILGYINARKLFTKSKVNITKSNALKSGLMPISILVPAYNEEMTIQQSIMSMQKVVYPEFEIIVVNDGSKDDTVKVLIEKFDLKAVEYDVPQRIPTQKIKQVYKSKTFPNLTVVDKENGGKSDALNCAINYSIFPLVCCVDSDSVFEESGLIQMAIPFFEYPDEMAAVGGTIRVGNSVQIENGQVKDIKASWNYFALIQIVEYLRAFLVGRMGWDYIDANMIISGAFGLFKKKFILDVGGYTRGTIGEDLELLLKIHMNCLKNKIPYKVKLLPDPVCWTEVPTDFTTLGNQRSRWQQGLAEGIRSARKMFFKPWSGIIGWLALPYYTLFELLSAPIELFGYLMTGIGVATGILDLTFAFHFFMVSMVYGWILTFGAIIIEEFTFNKYTDIEDYLKLCIGTLLEQFGYRQLHLYWRARGIYRFVRGKHSWGKMKRTGFKAQK